MPSNMLEYEAPAIENNGSKIEGNRQQALPGSAVPAPVEDATVSTRTHAHTYMHPHTYTSILAHTQMHAVID
jgi:hypothetical protein